MEIVDDASDRFETIDVGTCFDIIKSLLDCFEHVIAALVALLDLNEVIDTSESIDEPSNEIWD